MCIRDRVAGTHEGITAIQMDIKIHGLTRPIVEEAIRRTKEAREYILTEVMEKCIAEPRNNVNKYAPKIIQIQIDPQKIGDVVGQRGKTINAIIERTGVQIDISDEGAVSICGVDQRGMDEAAPVSYTHLLNRTGSYSGAYISWKFQIHPVRPVSEPRKEEPELSLYRSESVRG